ncbi:response regulator [Saccharibacillus alkalitolerans]|uniref:Response regulator n=1 Tax=Saccharibacillus alkalitolerans TaxID=2705290 RepID=A0ABX0F4D6_9BACL|nr:response regulator [Saccharibacillus alkalitolerans]NGZ74779.1 response regulator [Saccharibacillus alkalitolerans]
MYKVIVADDEPLMLEGWKTMVDWAGCGYELCGSASDGEEALELFGAVEPDLVMTDIRMPGLDGLGLIRAIKNRPGSHARSVIVSGYAEFGYAQQALRCGVDRYVLKPIVTEEIHSVLCGLLPLLDSGRRERESAAALREAEESASVLRLLQGGCSAEQASLLLGGSAGSRLCMLLAEACGQSASLCAGRTAALDAMRRLADELVAAGTRAWAFEEGAERAGLLCACDARTLERRLERLRESAAGLALYAGGEGQGYEALPALYGQALSVRGRVLPFGRPGLYRHADFERIGSAGFSEALVSAERVLKHAEAGDPESAARAVSELFRLFDRLRAPAGWMEGVVRHIAGELLRRRSDSEPGDNRAPEEESGLKDAFCMPCTEAELLRRCTEEAERLRRSRSGPEASEGARLAEAVEHVRRHYRDTLQLRELAARFDLNPVCFGQQFKRATGYGFNDYIHRLRAEEARRLLRRTDMKVSEIGCELGYHDTEYFTAKFKAATGELPSLYRARERVKGR